MSDNKKRESYEEKQKKIKEKQKGLNDKYIDLEVKGVLGGDEADITNQQEKLQENFMDLEIERYSNAIQEVTEMMEKHRKDHAEFMEKVDSDWAMWLKDPGTIPCQNIAYNKYEKRLNELQNSWSLSKSNRQKIEREIWQIKQEVIASEEESIKMHKEWEESGKWYKQPIESIIDKFYNSSQLEMMGYGVCLASRNDTPIEMLRFLARNKSRVIRSAAAYNSEMPLEELRILSKDKCGEVAIIAEDNLLRKEKMLADNNWNRGGQYENF